MGAIVFTQSLAHSIGIGGFLRTALPFALFIIFWMAGPFNHDDLGMMSSAISGITGLILITVGLIIFDRYVSL